MTLEKSQCNLALKLLFLSFLKLSSAIEMGSGEEESEDGNFFTQNLLVSVAVLCTIVLVAVGCTVAFWKRVFCFWRKQGTHEAPPEWFQPQGQGAASFSTLDASSLPRDVGGRSSIQIDPLPSLGELGLDGRDSFELRTFRTPGIVPSSVGTAEIPIDDWHHEAVTGFPRQNLEYQKIIGKGWFGKVLEAEALNIKQYVRASYVIVKELRTNATEEEAKRFLNEARIFRDANQQHSPGTGSDNILKLLGFCVGHMPYILILEYYPLGDLKSYLKQRAKQAPSALKPNDDGILIRMIIDIIRGVKWMIHAGFVHGDLSARNCLVATSAGKVIIGDYGVSPQKHPADYFRASNQAIPVRWAAPESFTFDSDSFNTVQNNGITHEANIWSLGVVIWEVLQVGKLPYENLTDEDVIAKVMMQGSYILEPPRLPFVNHNTKDNIYHLLASCWNSTPGHRPSIEDIEQVFTTPTPTS